MIYNKLVRDNIPDIIRQNGGEPNIKVLYCDDGYEYFLLKKLFEEIEEFEDTKDIEEIADIMEVLYALSNFYGTTDEKLDEIRLNKKRERGGFSKKYLLESTED